MNHELQHDLYMPPQVWKLMAELGYYQWVKAEHPDMWVDLTIANVEATLMLFVYERRQFLKGLDKS